MAGEAAGGRTKGKRIFLSYGHDDHASFAARLKNDLAAAGYDVWFDADRIQPGGDWERYIEEGLSWLAEGGKAGCFVLLMTPYSVRRPDGFCLNELTRAVARNVRILPVMLAWCEPPLSICRIQWLDMQDCIPLEQREDRYSQKFSMLVNAIDHDGLDSEGFHSLLLSVLRPLSFDADIRYKMDHFIGRAWVFEAIDRWLTDIDAGRIFWVSGNPGVGKTALSAWLCAHKPEVIAYHFCRNDNAQKIDPRRFVMSIVYQLSTQLPVYEDRLRHLNLDDIRDLDARSLMDLLIIQPLSSGFPSPGGVRVVLVDAVDEATVGGKNELVSLIASGFERAPDWLRLIVTARPEPEIVGPLQAYTPFRIDDGWKNEDDICLFLSHEIGDMASPQVMRNIMKKCGGLFIYAEWVVRELKLKRLSLDRLDEFPQGMGGIYMKYFERQFPDTGLWESRIRPALEAMSAAQEPLSLKAMSSIFRWSSHDERAFKRSLGSLFVDEGGVLLPFHKSVMEWLTDEDKLDQYFVSIVEGHRTIAGYLMGEYGRGNLAHPMMKYLAQHLYLADRWNDISAVIKDMNFIRYEWAADKFNMMMVFAMIDERPGLRVVDSYRSIVESPGSYESADLFTVADIFQRTYHFDEAFTLFDYLAGHYRKANDFKGMMDSIDNQAWILINRCDYDRAMTLLQEQERIYRDVGDDNGLQGSLLNEANIIWRKNEFDAALTLLSEQEAICRRIGHLDGLQESLNNQAMILRAKGSMDKAEGLLREQEMICRQSGNIPGLIDALIDRGLILRAFGDLDGAMVLLKEAETLSRNIGNKELLRSSLSAQGVISQWRGDLVGAMAYHVEDEKICREFNYKYGVWESMCNQAVIHRMKNNLDVALRILDAALKICEDTDNKWGKQYCLGQKAIVLRQKGDLDGALHLHREEESICRSIGHRRDLSMSLSNQAIIYRMRGDLDGAIGLHLDSEKTLRDIRYKYGLQECLGAKAITLYEKGDLEAALACLKEQEALCLEMKLKLDLEKCLASKLLIVNALKELEQARIKAKAMALTK